MSRLIGGIPDAATCEGCNRHFTHGDEVRLACDVKSQVRKRRTGWWFARKEHEEIVRVAAWATYHAACLPVGDITTTGIYARGEVGE